MRWSRHTRRDVVDIGEVRQTLLSSGSTLNGAADSRATAGSVMLNRLRPASMHGTRARSTATTDSAEARPTIEDDESVGSEAAMVRHRAAQRACDFSRVRQLSALRCEPTASGPPGHHPPSLRGVDPQSCAPSSRSVNSSSAMSRSVTTPATRQGRGAKGGNVVTPVLPTQSVPVTSRHRANTTNRSGSSGRPDPQVDCPDSHAVNHQ